MLNSMTGYGSAQGQLDGATYIVEIKSVNHRYFKSKIKLPDPILFLEDDIEKFLSKKLLRGMVNYVLKLKNVPVESLFDIDEAAMKTYMQKLSRLVESVNAKFSMEVGSLLSLPGIIQPLSPAEEKGEQIKKTVLAVTEEATERLKDMRKQEGIALTADVEEHCKVISRDLNKIKSRAEIVLDEYRKRLKKRVDDLLAEGKFSLDSETLAREVAIYADRSDISEEISRLGSHLQQFSKICQTNEQAGRRLDFLSQEMLREANTIGSKSADSEISHLVINIKCSIERIKEQVQNVE